MSVSPTSQTANERPGVTSSYVVWSLYQGNENALPVGLIGPATQNNDGTAYEISSMGGMEDTFGKGSGGLLAGAGILFENGVTSLTVAAVPAEGAEDDDYKAAIAALCQKSAPRIIVCDSTSQTVLTALRDQIAADSAAQMERVAICPAPQPDTALTLAAALNSERMMLCAGAGVVGEQSSPFFTACAMAGLYATAADPSANLSGSAMTGIASLAEELSEADIQRLLSGGVTPFETVGGAVECVKPVSTRTTTDGVPDRTWHSMGVIMTIDYVMIRLRQMLKIRMKGAKNNLATRESIRSQVALELATLCQNGILDDYGPPQVFKSESDPGVCQVELSFKVSGAMDRIHVAAYITI